MACIMGAAVKLLTECSKMQTAAECPAPLNMIRYSGDTGYVVQQHL